MSKPTCFAVMPRCPCLLLAANKLFGRAVAGGSEVDQQALATKPDNLSYILGPTREKETVSFCKLASDRRVWVPIHKHTKNRK